jgi:hypothetical protein
MSIEHNYKMRKCKEVLDKKTDLEKVCLLYEWVKTDAINLQMFKSLLDYIQGIPK